MPEGFDPALVIIEIGGKEYVIEDENITIDNLYKGNYELIIKSPEFVDIRQEVEIKAGENDLGIIDLTPAADIVADIYDWTTDRTLAEIKFEGIDREYKFKDEKFIIEDFEDIDNLFALKFGANGYIDNRIERRIVLGLNDIGKIYLYPDQDLYTISKTGRLAGLKMDLSSTNITAISVDEISAIDPANIKFVHNNILYRYDKKTNQPQKINEYKRGLIYLNNTFETILEVVDDSGEYLVYKNASDKVLTKFEKLPTNVLVSDDGRFAYFSFEGDMIAGLYQVALEYGTTRQLIDQEIDLIAIDQKGEQIIYNQAGKIYNYNTRIFKSSAIDAPSSSKAVYANNKWYILTGDSVVIMENNFRAIDSLDLSHSIDSITLQGDLLVLKSTNQIYLINTANPNIIQSILFNI